MPRAFPLLLLIACAVPAFAAPTIAAADRGARMEHTVTKSDRGTTSPRLQRILAELEADGF